MPEPSSDALHDSQSPSLTHGTKNLGRGGLVLSPCTVSANKIIDMSVTKTFPNRITEGELQLFDLGVGYRSFTYSLLFCVDPFSKTRPEPWIACSAPVCHGDLRVMLGPD